MLERVGNLASFGQAQDRDLAVNPQQHGTNGAPLGWSKMNASQ
jgi:hypothetical protein